MIEKDRFFFYFPREEASLARGLAESCADMAAFLADRGLPVTRPLHIILDEDLDEAKAKVYMYPHREIRLPCALRASLKTVFCRPTPGATSCSWG